MTEHISFGPYTLLQRDPTSSLPGKVDHVLKKLLKEGKIDISVFNSCRNLQPRPPQLYGLSKIHKPNTPIRPIVSFYNTPLIALHKTLAHYIQPLTHSHLRIRDSKHMIHILHDNPHPNHSYYCSFDIKSLYTSCSMKLAQRTVIEQFTSDPSLLPAHFSITALDTLISFCLHHSYFEYNGSLYSQTEGGPMGSPLTVALAEVRVTNIESLALALALASSADPPSLLKHFVDDGISRYRDRQHAESFLEHLNSLSDDLVYTIEHPKTGYYLGITTDRNYQLLELPLINVGNSNVGNSEVFDRNFHFLLVSYRNYYCFLAAHRHLLVANFSCYGPSDDSRTILRHELYCDTHYIATSPKPHCNQYPNP